MDPGGQCVEGEGAGLRVGPGKLGNRLFGDDVEYEMDVTRLHDETYIGNPHTTGVSQFSVHVQDVVTVNLSPGKFFFHNQDLVPSAGELKGNATQVRLLNPHPGKAADTAAARLHSGRPTRMPQLSDCRNYKNISKCICRMK